MEEKNYINWWKNKKILRFVRKIIGKELFSKFFFETVPTIKSEDFIQWWNDYKKSNTIDLDLQLMLDELTNSQNFKNYSHYWNYLAQSHIIMLSEYGIENFKQTIEKEIVGTTVTIETLKPILNDEILLSYNRSELSKKHDLCSKEESHNFNKANLVLLNYLVKNNYQAYLDKVEEPQYGNPIIFNYQNKRYTYSLLNSILDIDTLEKNIDFNQHKSIVEIGAGSGKLCSTLFQMKNNLNYTIVDIPPALFLSQSNLLNIFKNKKIFKYKNFKNFNEIEKEFTSCDIRFLLPEQLKLIPNKFFDLSIAIDCLHEFNKNQVEKYFDEFDRISNFFYFKCQNIQWSKFERSKKYDIISYPVKSNWSKIIHEKCYIPNGYFQALYKVN